MKWATSAAFVVLLSILAGCGLPFGSTQGPLAPTDDTEAGIALNIDASLVSDIDPVQSLRNHSDSPIRILRIESIPNRASPARLEVTTFHMVGPEREATMSGGLATEKDVGARLIPPSQAVIPPHSGADDYALEVRYRVPAGSTWALDDGLRVHYRWKGRDYVTVWNWQVFACSPKRMGKAECDRAADDPDKYAQQASTER